MVRILVACGNGIATSTVVASKIKDYAEENGLNISTDQTKLLEVPAQGDNYDLVVTTGSFDGEINTPVINGMPILTGIGEEETLEKIHKAIEDFEEE